MAREQQRPAIRVAVAAPYPEIVAIHESSTEYADDVEVCGMISSADAVFDQTRLLQPDILLLSDELGVDGPDTLARLTAVAPNTRLVVLVGRGEGRAPVIADAVLSHDAPAAELRAVIAEAAGRPSAQPAPPAHSRAEPGGAPARLVAVFSGKGGVGTSIVAANLATLLAQDGATVALVDLDLQYGDQGVLLHLEAHPASIETVVGAGETVDAGSVARALATSAAGVHVLLAPSRPEAGDLVTAADLEAILGELSRQHDHVVVDCPAHLEERIVGVLEAADHILLVSSFGITSVKDAKTTLRLLQSLGIEPARVALLLNRTRPRDSSPEEEIARALRFPVLATLPFEARMDESVESGRPLVAIEPRGEFSKRLGVVAGHVARPRDGGAPAGAGPQPSSWRLRFRH
ncbi:MAG TPA: P-loop NTPase [Candidatus Dormibacteraeota bacterium]|nr:P-loop NTPase [Candidatus Dormibacteraeota bacterium]